MSSAIDVQPPATWRLPTADDDCRFVEQDGVRCAAALDDGEGYDGYCGPHADRLEAAGHWS